MLLHREKINYPSRALREQVGGEVLLEVDLDDQGVPIQTAGRSGWLFGPSKVAAKREAWMQLLIDHAGRSVRNWRFASPDSIGSRVILLPVRFQMGKATWHRAHWVEMPPTLRSGHPIAESTMHVSAEGEAADPSIRLLSELDQAIGGV